MWTRFLFNGFKDLVVGVVELANNGVKSARHINTERKLFSFVVIHEYTQAPQEYFFGYASGHEPRIPLGSRADETVAGTKKLASQILYDPDLLLEGLGQSVSDTYEEKGMSYMTGYIAVDIAAEIVLTKGIGKLDDLAKAGKVAESFEDIAGTVQAIDKIENVGHARIFTSFGDVAMIIVILLC